MLLNNADVLPASQIAASGSEQRTTRETILSTYNPSLYQTLQVLFDLMALSISWWATIQLRLVLNPLMAVHLSGERIGALAPPLMWILLLWVGTVLWLRLYRPHEVLAHPFSQVLESTAIVSTVTILATFFSHGYGVQVSRSFVVLFAPVSALLLVSGRVLTRWACTFAAARYLAPKSVAVIGSVEDAWAMAAHIRQASGGAVRVAGIIVPDNSRADLQQVSADRLLGTTGNLAVLINREQLDHVIVVGGSMPHAEVEHAGYIAKRMGVTISRAIGIAERGSRMEVTTRYGMRLLDLKPVAFTRRQEAVKRAFDMLLSGATLVAFSPILVLAAMAVKLTSPGPVLYRSQRVGRGGRYFTFLKFRTMYVDERDRAAVRKQNERSGHLFKIRRDPRVTPVGRLMRRYSIDELPQVINVLRGEMSILGPRPLPAEDLDPDGMSAEFAVWAEQRARVLPGITGLWQIRGRSDLSFEEMMDLDVTYIREWSLALDLRILLATPIAVLGGRGAY